MKLNEIREIVAFMKEEGVCELEYTERSTSIRLKLTPPAPPRPWDRFRAGQETPEASEAEDAQAEPVEDEGTNVEIDLNEAAEKVRKGAVKAGSKVVAKVKAGASYLKSRRDEFLAGNTPGAYDVELVEEDEPETAPAPEAPEEAPEETPVVGEVPEYVPKPEAAQDEAPSEDAPQEENPVKLDLDAAKTAVSKTAEVVVNATKAAVELGAAGVRRGGAFLGDFFHAGEEEVPAAEEVPAEEAPAADVPAEQPEQGAEAAPDAAEAEKKEE